MPLQSGAVQNAHSRAASNDADLVGNVQRVIVSGQAHVCLLLAVRAALRGTLFQKDSFGNKILNNFSQKFYEKVKLVM